MIIDKNQIDPKIFLNIFKKKFDNFCTRVPLFVSYDITPTSVTLYQYIGDDFSKRKKMFTYQLDFSKDAKFNINDIKQKLLNDYCPIIIQNKNVEVKYTDEELNHKISSNEIKFEDILPNGSILEQKDITWRIERINVMYDIVFVRNLITNEIVKCKLRMPCIRFLKKILNMDVQKRWKFFEKKVKFSSDFYEVDIDNNIIKKDNEENNE